MQLIDAPDDLDRRFGLGVAGNFAGHLEQAGEAADFADVTPTAPEAPKGIFPWYAPGAGTFLGTAPLDAGRILLPAAEGPANLQIEPEAGVLFEVDYLPDGSVAGLRPTALGAFNDCSIRRPGATKISHKKNWGPASKGLARRLFAVADIEAAGPTGALRLASFLRRDGVSHAYGVDSALAGYSYYGTVLIDWLVDRLAHQRGSAGTPLEDVGALLRSAGAPAGLVVGIGATRYTPLGESTFLHPGDESVVVVYDGAAHSPADIEGAVADGAEHALAGASVLSQRVVVPA
ncbi:MAG: DUF5718 family protein [Miltoncostaeaceae bacterium]